MAIPRDDAVHAGCAQPHAGQIQDQADEPPRPMARGASLGRRPDRLGGRVGRQVRVRRHGLFFQILRYSAG
jgi:hypothetical protein